MSRKHRTGSGDAASPAGTCSLLMRLSLTCNEPTPKTKETSPAMATTSI